MKYKLPRYAFSLLGLCVVTPMYWRKSEQWQKSHKVDKHENESDKFILNMAMTRVYHIMWLQKWICSFSSVTICLPTKKLQGIALYGSAQAWSDFRQCWVLTISRERQWYKTDRGCWMYMFVKKAGTGSHFTRFGKLLTSCIWLFLLQAIAAASKLHMYTSVDTNFLIDSIEMNKQELASLKQNLSPSDIDERRLERTRSWLTSTIEGQKGFVGLNLSKCGLICDGKNFCICRFHHVVASTLELLTLWRKLQRARKSDVFCVSSRTAWAQVSWCAHPDQVSTLFQPWFTLRRHRLGVGKASDRIRTPMRGGKVDFLELYFFLVFHSMIFLFCLLLKSSVFTSVFCPFFLALWVSTPFHHSRVALITVTFSHCNVYMQTLMIKSQCTYWYRRCHRIAVRGLLINVNFEDLLSDVVERFTAVDSTPVRACTLCCCAIVLDINVLALPVEAHIVTNKPNQRESPCFSEKTLCTLPHVKTFSTRKWGPARIHEST